MKSSRTTFQQKKKKEIKIEKRLTDAKIRKFTEDLLDKLQDRRDIEVDEII